MRNDIKEILVTEEQVQAKVKELETKIDEKVAEVESAYKVIEF